MFARHFRVRVASQYPRRIAPLKGLLALVALAVSLVGCAVPTAPLVGTDPADPNAKVAGVGYRSGIAPYASLRPTTPLGWKEQNQRVTPSPKSGQ